MLSPEAITAESKADSARVSIELHHSRDGLLKTSDTAHERKRPVEAIVLEEGDGWRSMIFGSESTARAGQSDSIEGVQLGPDRHLSRLACAPASAGTEDFLARTDCADGACRVQAWTPDSEETVPSLAVRRGTRLGHPKPFMCDAGYGVLGLARRAQLRCGGCDVRPRPFRLLKARTDLRSILWCCRAGLGVDDLTAPGDRDSTATGKPRFVNMPSWMDRLLWVGAGFMTASVGAGR